MVALSETTAFRSGNVRAAKRRSIDAPIRWNDAIAEARLS